MPYILYNKINKLFSTVTSWCCYLATQFILMGFAGGDKLDIQ